MRQVIIIFFLFIFPGSIFGQYSLSKEVGTYLKNEKKYNKNAVAVLKNLLKKNNLGDLSIYDSNKTIPTFKVKKKYLKGSLKDIILNLGIDENILYDEVLILTQTFGDVKSFSGFTFCESDIWNLCEEDYNPEKFEKHEKATEKFIFGGNYDLVFKVENYPHFWFLWKDNQLSMYSFLNETLYVDKKELQSYLDKNPPILNIKHSHKPSPCHKEIKVVNKSNKKIYLSEYYNNLEITVPKITRSPLGSWQYVIENQESSKVFLYDGTCIEHLFYPINKGIMTVFVFDGSILESKGWDYVKENNLFLKRYDLTLKNLEDMNWKITYDGN